MSEYTPEQIAEAKAYLKQWAETAVSCRSECEKTILSTLDAVQKERDALKAELATPILVSVNRLADSLADARAYAAKLEKAGDGLRDIVSMALAAMCLPETEAHEIATWDAARKEKP